MKAVMISIQPKWCELIASRKKTVEVRKSKPKLEFPFKCYIYETQGKTETPWMDEDGHMIFRGRGMVIGEFVCDCIGTYWFLPGEDVEETEDVQLACLSEKEIFEYANTKELHFWHISDLVIYDKPKTLGDFRIVGCKGCRDKDTYHCIRNCFGERKLKRPPQSWCYVEEMVVGD